MIIEIDTSLYLCLIIDILKKGSLFCLIDLSFLEYGAKSYKSCRNSHLFS